MSCCCPLLSRSFVFSGDRTMPKVLPVRVRFTALAILLTTSFAVAASPPQAVEVQGSLGYVARLADGRLIAVHGECRPRQKWDDASIAQPIFGRFSSDGGRTWTSDALLFNSPGPGC